MTPTPSPTFSGTSVGFQTPGVNSCVSVTLNPSDYTSPVCLQAKFPQSDLIVPTLVIVAVGMILSFWRWIKDLIRIL